MPDYFKAICYKYDYALLFQQSQDPLMREVYRKMIHPELDNLPGSATEGFKRLCTRNKYAFISPEINSETERETLPCNVVRIPGTAIPSHLSMAVAKGSPYKGILDHYSLQLSSNGIIKRLYRQAYTSRASTANQNFQQLDFQAVTPLLLVLGTGMVLSLLLFVVEHIVYNFYAGCHEHLIYRQRRRKLLTSAKVPLVRKARAIHAIKKQDAFVKVQKKKSRRELKLSRSFCNKIHVGLTQEQNKGMGLIFFEKK
ncbi:uncharacterized protein LOC110835198 [Zootermopsis nevadensis]|uniref:uncharacterized protein LOC110835198 n=1 Tax=Zootermopsis nevadensis TaxID=136037 RepID=UPI000B8E3CB8|nr:uncharacterized protein LOC110835198 [Zootermopsis nevadensis]